MFIFSCTCLVSRLHHLISRVTLFIFRVSRFLIIFSLKIYVFMYLFNVGLHWIFTASWKPFFSCGKRGLLSWCGAQAYRSGFSCWGEWAPESRLRNCRAHGPSCLEACGIFPDQGSNPCPLNWQADSQPLDYQGSPVDPIFVSFISLNTLNFILYPTPG